LTNKNLIRKENKRKKLLIMQQPWGDSNAKDYFSL